MGQGTGRYLLTLGPFFSSDIPIGGKWPGEQYEKMVALLQNSLNFMALISQASASFTLLQQSQDSDHDSQWLFTFRRLIADADVTSQAVTTLLSLLSASVRSGQPLPPYLKVPERYQLIERMEQMDEDILSIRHIAKPGYASFAVIQTGTRCIIDDLKLVLDAVKELVGELDFTYHIVSTKDSSASPSETELSSSRPNEAEDPARAKME